jgi:Subtilase family
MNQAQNDESANEVLYRTTIRRALRENITIREALRWKTIRRSFRGKPIREALRWKTIRALRANDIGVRARRDLNAEQWDRLEIRGQDIYFAGSNATLDRDTPTVLLYQLNQLAVRDEAVAKFLERFKATLEEPIITDYEGLAGAKLVTFRGTDAFDLILEYYDRQLPPNKVGLFDGPPGDPEALEMDDVSLLHLYWLESHVFFWPRADPSQPTTVPPLPDPAPNPDGRVVIVLDTGLTASHLYFAGQAGYVFNEAKGREDANRPQYKGHGSAVAGAARRRNAGATIRGTRLERIGNLDPLVEEQELVKTINAIPPQGPAPCVVLNLSLGGKVIGTSSFYDAIKQFQTRGPARHRVVAAAGNIEPGEPREEMFPAAWPNVYGVASGDVADAVVCVPANPAIVHDWSNYGANWVDFVADGEDVTTAGYKKPPVPNDFVIWSGTSFAAPQVAARFPF